MEIEASLCGKPSGSRLEIGTDSIKDVRFQDMTISHIHRGTVLTCRIYGIGTPRAALGVFPG